MRVAASILLCLWASVVSSHEFWIAPQKFQAEKNEDLSASFVNGENFKGSELAWFDNRVARAFAVVGDGTYPITGRLGDIPALKVPTKEDGLVVIAVETKPSTLTYRKPEKFRNFVEHKKLGVDADAQDYPFREIYTRHVKSLIGVASGIGADRALGLETEIIALQNPFTDNLTNGLEVIVNLNNLPRARVQIEVFEKAPDQTVSVFTLRSDAEGKAIVPVKPGHQYLLDAVTLRRPAEQSLTNIASPADVEWETLWAALTFEVPG